MSEQKFTSLQYVLGKKIVGGGGDGHDGAGAPKQKKTSLGWKGIKALGVDLTKFQIK